MYPYRQYITAKSMDDADLSWWASFNSAKGIPWAITRTRHDNKYIYTLWVWGAALPSHDDCYEPPARCHLASIRMEGNGFSGKLSHHLMLERRGGASLDCGEVEA